MFPGQAVTGILISVLMLQLSFAIPVKKQLTPIQSDNALCETCRFLSYMLHNLWGDQALQDCAFDLVTFLCTELHILSDNFICKAMVSTLKEEMIYIIGEVTKTPDEICGLLIEDCGYNFFNVSWDLPLPGNKPSVGPLIQPESGRPTLKVLHLSDLHIDMEYEVGSEADCGGGMALCCRPVDDQHERVKPDAIKRPAGYWGTVGPCDAPYWLLENMLQDIATRHSDIDYVVIAGDLESHADWDYTPEGHTDMIKNISDTIRRYFPSKWPVYFAMGNHEGVPMDTFTPHWAPERFSTAYLYNAMADSWRQWLSTEALDNLKFRGSYVTRPYPGLRVISLNNILGDYYNFFLLINQTDPDGTMSWFRDQLYSAEQAGDKVHIVAHIPGGTDKALEGWAMNYYRIINRFESTVMGQFFGHTHSEEFYMTYENPMDHTSRPTSVIHGGPSLTPNYNFFPAYRIYTIDGNYSGSSFQILDIEAWYLNLTEANADTEHPEWKPLYRSIKEEYGLSSMIPDQWNGVIERMQTNDALLQRYNRNFFRQDIHCDDQCRSARICQARKAHQNNILCKDLNIVGNDKKSHSNLYGTLDLLNLDSVRKRLRKHRRDNGNHRNGANDDKCPLD